MADGRWVTLENGTHVFIKKGQSLDDAMSNLSGGSDNPKIDYSEIEKRKHETPQQSYQRLQDDLKKFREELNAGAFDDDYDFENWDKEEDNNIKNRVKKMIEEGKNNTEIKNILEQEDEENFDWYEADDFINSVRDELGSDVNKSKEKHIKNIKDVKNDDLVKARNYQASLLADEGKFKEAYETLNKDVKEFESEMIDNLGEDDFLDLIDEAFNNK